MTEVAVFVDGGCLNGGPGAYAAVVVSEHGEVLVESARKIDGRCTNNRAEYSAILLGVCLARLVGAQSAHFYSDSQLVVQQITGRWDTREPDLIDLRDRARSSLRPIDWTLHHVYRSRNARADWLAGQMIDYTSKRLAPAAPPAEFYRPDGRYVKL